MDRVTLESNTYNTLSLGGIFLVTSGHGAIRIFEDNRDKFINWSALSPGTYPAISASGTGMGRALISQLSLDPQWDRLAKGRAPLNLKAFSKVTQSPLKPPQEPAK